MNNKTVAIYGGTFDPPTTGHWQMIKKACDIFDELYVVVATAHGKNPMFTEEVRQKMLEDLIPNELWLMNETYNDPKIKIVTLPKGVFMATFAKQIGAQFLVRGIRDEFDFHYENQIYRTNKKIEPKVETIYLMPSEEMSLVSSSWVKSLMGHYGWRQTVAPYVSPKTLASIAFNYAKTRFLQTAKNHELDLQHPYRTWGHIESQMLDRKYHNIFHILDCIEAMELFYGADTIMEFAFWLHDICGEEDECISYAKSLLRHADQETTDKVAKLIESTKHFENQTGELDDEEQQVFASIDLLCLGQVYKGYIEYSNNLYEEYLKKSGVSRAEFVALWKKGRSEFLEKMLSRTYIFPWKKLRENFEERARRNLEHELKVLEKMP